jgi:chromosome segregation ATPase
MKTNTTLKFNKQQIKQLISSYAQAQEHCRAIEREARDARGEVDAIKAQLLDLHNNGIELRSGNVEAVVTESQRDGYFVKPSVRTTITVKTN